MGGVVTYPTTTGVVAFFADRGLAGAAATAVAGGAATSVVLHTAIPTWEGPLLGVVRAVGEEATLGPAFSDAGATDVYAATFRRVKEHPRTWADGEQTPGLGALFAICRRPDLTHQDSSPTRASTPTGATPTPPWPSATTRACGTTCSAASTAS
jgi:hypothetical protein